MAGVDVLIVTAVQEEYEAVIAVESGAVAGSKWEENKRSGVALRDFDAAGRTLRIAVTQALGMGSAPALIAAASLIDSYQVRCLAMCGVCAGRRDQVALGDVIIADRVWQYDVGKREAAMIDGKPVPREQGSVETFHIQPATWKQKAERFQIDRAATWPALRPRSYEAQGDWILKQVLSGADPATDAGRATMCANFDTVLALLWKKKLLNEGTLTLTEDGTKHIERVLLLNAGALPEARALRVHVGPIASGNKVIADSEVFDSLSNVVRDLLGVEMEVAAVGRLAHTKNMRYFVAMKAVMDHADTDKNDNFKGFAARASAEVLIAFIRDNLPPRRTWERWRLRVWLTAGLLALVLIGATLRRFDSRGECDEIAPVNVTVACMSDPHFREMARRAPDAQKNALVLEAVQRLDDEFQNTSRDRKPEGFTRGDFAAVEQICEFISALDHPDNGHVQYYRGEIYWRLKDRPQLRDYLNRYVEVVERPSEREAISCKTEVRGYCFQRTDWVLNLLANDLFKEANEQRDSGTTKRELLTAAHAYAVRVLQRRKARGVEPEKVSFPKKETVLSSTDLELLTRDSATQ